MLLPICEEVQHPRVLVATVAYQENQHLCQQILHAARFHEVNFNEFLPFGKRRHRQGNPIPRREVSGHFGWDQHAVSCALTCLRAAR